MAVGGGGRELVIWPGSKELPKLLKPVNTARVKFLPQWDIEIQSLSDHSLENGHHLFLFFNIFTSKYQIQIQ